MFCLNFMCVQMILLYTTWKQYTHSKLNHIPPSICDSLEPDLSMCSGRCGQPILLPIYGLVISTELQEGQKWQFTRTFNHTIYICDVLVEKWTHRNLPWQSKLRSMTLDQLLCAVWLPKGLVILTEWVLFVLCRAAVYLAMARQYKSWLTKVQLSWMLAAHVMSKERIHFPLFM